MSVEVLFRRILRIKNVLKLEFMNGQQAALFWSQEYRFIGFRRKEMRALPVATDIIETKRNNHMLSSVSTGAARPRMQYSSILLKDDVDLYLKMLLSREF